MVGTRKADLEAVGALAQSKQVMCLVGLRVLHCNATCNCSATQPGLRHVDPPLVFYAALSERTRGLSTRFAVNWSS